MDLETGATTEAFVRDMGNVFTETEGLSIAEGETGTAFHYLDVAIVSRSVIRMYVPDA